MPELLIRQQFKRFEFNIEYNDIPVAHCNGDIHFILHYQIFSARQLPVFIPSASTFSFAERSGASSSFV